MTVCVRYVQFGHVAHVTLSLESGIKTEIGKLLKLESLKEFKHDVLVKSIHCVAFLKRDVNLACKIRIALKQNL